jgi:hypothetical protein
MKCPYRKKVIHKDKRHEMYTIKYAQDIEEFCECDKEECPFYRSEKDGYSGENCSRADAECRRYN